MPPQKQDDDPAPRPEGDEAVDAALEAPLLSSLADVVPGFELLDSDLVYDGIHRVHYAGVDGDGRLTLVLRVRGEGHSAVLRALDARDFARRHLAPLLKLLGARRARAELEPRVVLVGSDFEERLRRRLAALEPLGVTSCELQRLRSHAGELVFLAPLASDTHGLGKAAPTLDEWLAGLGAERRSAVEDLMGRLERLDDGLELEHERHGLTWRLGERVLAALELHTGGEARLVVPGRAARRWRTPRDAELFLEDAVAAYLSQGDGLGRVDLVPPPPPGAGAPGVRKGQERARGRSLLTPEELEALGD